MAGEWGRKFGLRPGQRVLMIGAPATSAARLRAEAPAGIRFVRSPGTVVDQIFCWPKDVRRLATELSRLQRRLDPDGSVWIVMPKKAFAASRGVHFTWEAMQAEGLKGDFVDNKVATFDDRDYATRFVVRKERRRARG